MSVETSFGGPLRAIGVALLFAAATVAADLPPASTRYVDPGCIYDGDGSAVTCASSPGGAGPKKALQDGIDLLDAGVTLNLRGPHDATTNCNGFDGHYHTGDIPYKTVLLDQRRGTASAPMVIQNYGYTGNLDGGEHVYWDAAETGATWERCSWNSDTSSCDCGAVVTGIMIGADTAESHPACGETWYVTNNNGKFFWAVKDNGVPTLQTQALSEMTNSTTGYSGLACSTSAWMVCKSDTDCPKGETCTGTNPEVDSFTTYGHACSSHPNMPCLVDSQCPTDETCEQVTPYLLVRWGSSLPSHPNVVTDSIGTMTINARCYDATKFCGVSHLTVRGIYFGARSGAALAMVEFPACGDDHTGCFQQGSQWLKDAPADHITFTVNRALYSSNFVGSDYNVVANGTTPLTISNNDLGYSCSESIHTHPPANGAAVVQVSGNFIHDSGDVGLFGYRFWYPNFTSLSTPLGIIFGAHHKGSEDNADYSGSDAYGNVIQRTQTTGISLENGANHFRIHDNVFYGNAISKGEALDLSVSPGTGGPDSSHNEVWNNLILASNGYGIVLAAGNSDGPSVTRNKIYNNTIVDARYDGIICWGSSDISNNEFRNNLIFNNTDTPGFDCSPAVGSGNVFEYNLVSVGVGSGHTAAVLQGTSKTCSNLSDLGPGNINGCASGARIFSSSGDYHLSATSPAKNAGTSTGMPGRRTHDIDNALSGLHGLEGYSDNNILRGGVWDIGADEYFAKDDKQKPADRRTAN